MNKFPLIAILCAVIACNPLPDSPELDPASYVNPLIGTDFTGNTYPGAQVPFGMVQLSPDNGLPGWDRIAGYFYPDSTIAGFSHTHLSGTGAGDLYDISFMPAIKPEKSTPQLGIYSSFSHENETVEAGYYQVLLQDYTINVELTATPRCGIQRYTFPQAEAVVYLNLAKAMNWDATQDSYIEVVDSTTIRGYRYSDGWARGQKIWFYTRFSRPFDSYRVDSTEIGKRGEATGAGYVARFDFQTKKGEQIVVKTAVSGVSMLGAARNMEQEAPHFDFDEYRHQARERWNEELSKIVVKGDNHDDKVVFYTALYHSMLAPTLYCDVDGVYMGADRQVYQSTDFQNYSTFSLWDTYRASHPLFTYTQPERTNDMVKSFLAFYEQYGSLPLWNMWASETDMMIGYHAVPVIVDAYLKGIGNFDAEKALEACIISANRDDYHGIGAYKKLGYIPYTEVKEWSMSKTLEYAYDDHCIARMAEAMGGKEEIVAEFDRRAQHYRNLFDSTTGFFRPRDETGQFISDFDPKDYSDHITESNAWQYYWSVPQDIEGLIEITGGVERFGAKLDSMFTYNPEADDELPIFSTGMIGQYAQGNEPSHHVIYLFNAVKQPWKTQQYAAKVMHELYLNTPAGLCGNEDCGQMSAWYLFSSMGFYPVDPVAGRYEIGTPLFPEVTLRLNNGKQFRVLAPAVSRENIYIQSIRVNGLPYDKSYLTHQQIMEGATVELEMGNQPGSAWY
ncbi:GH92 family glycosyl hydrolase [Parabacteroides sp. OttesenSCG-928-N08]|nr:GH92 family glycosyl hydrolase [Parabacteroides sp. OttesenSCG-928-N08]